MAPDDAEHAIRPRARRGPAPAPARAPTRATTAPPSPANASDKAALACKRQPPPPRAKPELAIVRIEPVLALRPARPSDSPAVAALLSQLSKAGPDAKAVARNLANLRKAGGDMHLAEFGIIAGCIAWSVIATPHRGNIGRITVLVVDVAHRRRGFGSKLLAFAGAALGKKGCTAVEAISDIDIRNSHNFFRAGNSIRPVTASRAPSKSRPRRVAKKHKEVCGRGRPGTGYIACRSTLATEGTARWTAIPVKTTSIICTENDYGRR